MSQETHTVAPTAELYWPAVQLRQIVGNGARVKFVNFPSGHLKHESPSKYSPLTQAKVGSSVGADEWSVAVGAAVGAHDGTSVGAGVVEADTAAA